MSYVRWGKRPKDRRLLTQVVWLNFIMDSQFCLGWEGPGAQDVISLTSASSTYLGNFRHRFPSTENPQEEAAEGDPSPRPLTSLTPL